MSDISTRSGMLWEVERILNELSQLNELPQILLMENVPQVHDSDNVNDFNKWQMKLSSLGYKNYFQDLEATDYGIPQSRKRCFMVSVLGDYNYKFPKKSSLKLELKDLLEPKVDNKYFISDKMKNGMLKTKFNSYKYENMDMTNKKICKTLTTATGERAPLFLEQQIIDKENYIQWYEKGKYESDTRAWKANKKCGTLTTRGNTKIINEKITKIRRLIPKECFRLMGVKDEDFKKIDYMSDSTLYHLAGDSIVVNVLMAIFNEFR